MDEVAVEPEENRPVFKGTEAQNGGMLSTRRWRLGLLSNGKPNSKQLLRAFEYRIADRISVDEVVAFEKMDFGESIDTVLLGRIAESCDAVLAGVGD